MFVVCHRLIQRFFRLHVVPSRGRQRPHSVLTLNAMEERALPSTTVFDNTSYPDLIGHTHETALISARVTADPPNHPGKYLWEYFVYNQDFNGPNEDINDIGGQNPGAAIVSIWLPGEELEIVSDLTTNRNMYSGAMFFGAAAIASAYWIGETDAVLTGESATFSFLTPPRPVVAGGAELWNRGYYIGIGGPTVGPGLPPKVVITDAGGNEVLPENGLRVAKWHSAFDVGEDGNTIIEGPDENGHDFIDRDDDRFNVRVLDMAAWIAGKQHVDLELSTKNVFDFRDYNDPPTTLRLIRMIGAGNAGWYWTDFQLLVSNVVDDTADVGPQAGADESGPGTATNVKNGGAFPVTDRTHMVMLGGTVKVNYTPTGMVTPITTQAPVLVKKIVKAHITLVREVAGEDGMFTAKKAEDAVIKANEQYAQVGIRLVLSTPAQTIDPPAQVDPTDGLENRSAYRGSDGMTPEERSLLNAAGVRTPATDDIELIFFNYFQTTDRGYAVLTGDYVDTAFVSFRAMSRFTVAHEIAHLLTGRPNIEGESLLPNQRVNLLRSPTSSTDTVLATKRLTNSQQDDMMNHRKNLLTDPT